MDSSKKINLKSKALMFVMLIKAQVMKPGKIRQNSDNFFLRTAATNQNPYHEKFR